MTIYLMMFEEGCNCSPIWVDTTDILSYKKIGEYYYIELVDLKADTNYKCIFEFEDIQREKVIALHVSHFRTKESSVGEYSVDTRRESVTISPHDFIKDGANVMGLNITPVAFNNGAVKRIYIADCFGNDVRLWVNEDICYEDLHPSIPIFTTEGTTVHPYSTHFYFKEAIDKTAMFAILRKNELTYIIVIEPYALVVQSFDGSNILKRYYKVEVIKSFMYAPNTVRFTLTIDENATFIEEDC